MLIKIIKTYQEASKCNQCFDELDTNLSRGLIPYAQPRWIGNQYFNAHTRVCILAINPSNVGTNNNRINASNKFTKAIKSLQINTKAWDSVMNFISRDMPFWGRGRYYDFYFKRMGLDTDKTALMNMMLCSSESNSYSSLSLSNCFKKYTLSILQELNPDVLILSGTKIISLFPGSRLSELKTLLPILVEFIKLMNTRFNEFVYIFHSTEENKNRISDELENHNLENTKVVYDKIIKSGVLLNSIFAVSKSGTVSLEICNAKVPSIIIYKINLINFLIMKSLVKVNFANLINIINNKEIIPELLQGECNAKEIFRSVVYFLKNPSYAQKQVDACSHTLNQIRSKSSSAEEAAKILSEYLVV